MTRYSVLFSTTAEAQLERIFAYIAEAASGRTAERYVGGIVDCCNALTVFPHRGTPRDDIRLGMRLTNYRGSTVIAFGIDTELVTILAIFYGGRNYEESLRSRLND